MDSRGVRIKVNRIWREKKIECRATEAAEEKKTLRVRILVQQNHL
jgi:hypothetical protein